MNKFRLAITSLLLVAALAAVSGCSKKKNTNIDPEDAAAGPPVSGDWVVTHSISDPETLNLITSQDASAQEIFTYIYETLTRTDEQTLKRIPSIAEELPTSDSTHLFYDFKIRKEAKFSDGKPITAEDFIFYLKAIKNPYILNALPLRTYFIEVDSAMIVDNDPKHLRVVMKSPYYLAEDIIGDMYAMPKHIWDPKGLTDKISFHELNSVTDPGKLNQAIKDISDFIQDVTKGRSKDFLVGSGPYKFDEWTRNERIVLVRNPNCWNKEGLYGLQYPDKIIWRTINDDNAAVTSLKSGDLDVMPRIMSKVKYEAEKKNLTANGLRAIEYDYPAYSYIGYNEDNPIFADKTVRNALAHAVNKDAIIKNVFLGYAKSIESPILSTRPEYDSTLKTIPYDLQTAKTMLAQAGWGDSDGDGTLDKIIDGKKTDFKFTILLNSGNPNRQTMAVMLVEELKKIGIDASTTTLEWSTFLKMTREGEYDAFIGGWVMNVTEGDLYQIWHSKSAAKGGSNHVRFRNTRVDSLIEKTRSEFNYEKRKEYYTEIQKIIYDEQPYNFLVSEKFVGARSARFHGVKFFQPQPCYFAGSWWVAANAQKYKGATKATASQ